MRKARLKTPFHSQTIESPITIAKSVQSSLLVKKAFLEDATVSVQYFYRILSLLQLYPVESVPEPLQPVSAKRSESF